MALALGVVTADCVGAAEGLGVIGVGAEGGGTNWVGVGSRVCVGGAGVGTVVLVAVGAAVTVAVLAGRVTTGTYAWRVAVGCTGSFLSVTVAMPSA